ncbi:MAG TPA: hypothetical protein VF499_14685 [Afipia sp.]
MRKLLELALVAPLAVLLVIAVAGAFIALFGALAGMENVKVAGGVFAGFGALGFFALLFSPFGEILSALSAWAAGGSSRISQMNNASKNLSVSGNKEEK